MNSPKHATTIAKQHREQTFPRDLVLLEGNISHAEPHQAPEYDGEIQTPTQPTQRQRKPTGKSS